MHWARSQTSGIFLALFSARVKSTRLHSGLPHPIERKINSVSITVKRVHTGCMGHQIVTTDVWKKKRGDLTAKRDALFKKYSQAPHDLDLAQQIKKIDDEVAECTDRMTEVKLSERKSKARPDPSKN